MTTDDQLKSKAEAHYIERTKLKRDVVSIEEEFKNEITVAYIAGYLARAAEDAAEIKKLKQEIAGLKADIERIFRAENGG